MGGDIVRYSILSRDLSAAWQLFSCQCICIPSSIETITSSCFAECRGCLTLAFEFRSRLSVLGESAFDTCSIPSICIPSSIETVPKSCFRQSTILHVRFEAGSRVSTLAPNAF
jgi:hypothetical protein